MIAVSSGLTLSRAVLHCAWFGDESDAAPAFVQGSKVSSPFVSFVGNLSSW